MDASDSDPGTVGADDEVYVLDLAHPVAIPAIIEGGPVDSIEIEMPSIALEPQVHGEEFVLSVACKKKATIEKALSQLVGGEGFDASVKKISHGKYRVIIFSMIGPLYAWPFAKRLKRIEPKLTIHVGTYQVPAF